VARENPDILLFFVRFVAFDHDQNDETRAIFLRAFLLHDENSVGKSKATRHIEQRKNKHQSISISIHRSIAIDNTHNTTTNYNNNKEIN
jgi:hypothetical protein